MEMRGARKGLTQPDLHVAGQADLQRNAPLGNVLHEALYVRLGVTLRDLGDLVGAEEMESVANTVRIAVWRGGEG
jgi:hypothetical protein